ncbi:MAG TPA: hypothetical protein VFL69_06940, partial [Marmoricola sp.]|nr:hypothetical protein [Marmoricola sp.]
SSASGTSAVDPRSRLTNRWSFIWLSAALANSALWFVLGVWWMLSLSVVMIALATKALTEERPTVPLSARSVRPSAVRAGRQRP